MNVEQYAVNYREVRDLLGITASEAKTLVAHAARIYPDMPDAKCEVEVGSIRYSKPSVDERYHKKNCCLSLLPTLSATAYH